MTQHQNVVRVAAVQAAPVLFQKDATIEKALTLIEEAASQGAKIIVFPEAFIPAYPRGLSFGFVVGSRTQEGRKDWQRYYDHSVVVPSKTTDILAEAAKKHQVFLVMGITEKDAERVSSTLFCTTLYFGPDGAFLGKHRKLKPTGSERLIWGEGNGSTLTVVDTPYGPMGGLICWENYMPLARQSMYSQGVKIYAAPTADSRDVWQCTVRHIALEGRCYVISCNQYVSKDMYPQDLFGIHDLAAQPHHMCPGGSCIIDPMGQYVSEPVYNRETIIYGDLDMDYVTQSRLDFDPVGHYARPDVFHFEFK